MHCSAKVDSSKESGRLVGHMDWHFLSPFDIFCVVQMVKNPPAMQETRVSSLDGEEPLEEGMTTHSSILAWKTPWTKELGRLQSMGSQIVKHH